MDLRRVWTNRLEQFSSGQRIAAQPRAANHQLIRTGPNPWHHIGSARRLQRLLDSRLLSHRPIIETPGPINGGEFKLTIVSWSPQ
jgi:hypothetical protein